MIGGSARDHVGFLQLYFGVLLPVRVLLYISTIVELGSIEQMNQYTKHIVLPAVAPVLIVGLYFTPLTVIGCLTRGLIAVTIALVSAVLAFVAIGFAFFAKRRRDPVGRWWILTAAILALPLALLVGPLG